MNNYDEMVSAGYEMSGEGFWIPSENSGGDINFDDEQTDDVKLVLLKNGDLLLTKVREVMGGDSIIFDDPKLVISRSAASADGNVTTTIQYSEWMSLSSSREFSVRRDFIATMSTPIKSLYDSYVEGKF